MPALTALQRDYNGVLSADTRKSVSLSAFARTVQSDNPRLFAAASTSSHRSIVLNRVTDNCFTPLGSSRAAIERKNLDISAIARSRSLRDFCVFRCALLCSVVPMQRTPRGFC